MQLLRAFRRRDFAVLVLARTISRLGDGIQAVALAWLVLQLTGSAAAMGLVLIAELVPTLALVIFGGAIADRWPKIPLLVSSDVIRAVLVGIIAVLVATGSVALLQLLALGVVFGLVDAVFMPTWAALLPELVPTDDRPSANALASLTARLAGIAGPAAGAALVAAGGMGVAFAVDGLSFALSGALLAWLGLARRRSAPVTHQVGPAIRDARHSAIGRRMLVADIRDGLAAVIATPWIGLTIGAAAITNISLAGPLGVAVPLLVERSLGGGVGVLGLYGSAVAAGAVVAAVALGSRARLRGRWRLVYGWWIAVALAAAAMGLPVGVGGLLVSALVIGFGEVAVGLAWTNALQDHVPDELLGRVYSLDYLGSAALIPVGYLVAGMASDAFGPSTVFLAGGVISAVILAAMTVLPQIRALD
jgi:DHA3 family tetracycline resistance protein-like MFS transporter